MRATLTAWINDADSLRHLRHFAIPQIPIDLGYITHRTEDYYLSLVGDLFDSMRRENDDASSWARLGNAFVQFASESAAETLTRAGINRNEAVLFASASFYLGGFPASACLTMRARDAPEDVTSEEAACHDFLARPAQPRSALVTALLNHLRAGRLDQLEAGIEEIRAKATEALREGPDKWVPSYVLQRALTRFRHANVRAVLPDGASAFWTPLVSSLTSRSPSTWEFFPSQVEAIKGGLLQSGTSFSLQMPTGAGKTTLCETLLFWHLKSRPDEAAVMLVPYRSLASELRGTLAKRLSALGLPTRCAYGGTVPTRQEANDLVGARAIVATPEALSGLLGADPALTRRISLVICDEGHLLDGGGRGVGLELLLARLRGRDIGAPRFVFVSAIVPNIEEINSWLGGTEETVIKSAYRPALAEFAVLRPSENGMTSSVALEMHPQAEPAGRFAIEGFLGPGDFRYTNPQTGRAKTYGYSSIKTQAVAAARKTLPMGATAIFAANKRGNQGAVGLTEELLKQLQLPLAMPKPSNFSNGDRVQEAVQYLEREYGADWIGTLALSHGCVLHHGDIPQETREALEKLIRDGDSKLVICTATLAEGVNLPIRSLVLYSVQRRFAGGGVENLLSRDIKNLVGRAGRAGAATKGLVICANPQQWPLVAPVANQGPGEPVSGALHDLLNALQGFLAQRETAVSNEFLEGNAILHPLIDGVDATLIDLIAEEIGEQEFVTLALGLASQTLASRKLEGASSELLRNVFALRAKRIVALRGAGRLTWLRETGARVRLIDSVERGLLPRRDNWAAAVDALHPDLVRVLLEWAWSHRDLRDDVREAYRLEPDQEVETVKDSFFALVQAWLSGARFTEIAGLAQVPVDEALAIHTRALTFSLQTLVEQGVSLLKRLLADRDVILAEGVLLFPEHLRYGVPTRQACVLSAQGVRHRSASVLLAQSPQVAGVDGPGARAAAIAVVAADEGQWRAALGDLVLRNTISDLS